MSSKNLKGLSASKVSRRRLLTGAGVLGFGVTAAVAGVAVADSSRRGGGVSFKVVTANIGRAKTADIAKAAIKKVHDELPGAVIGWQEINEDDKGDEHAMVGQVFGANYQNLFMNRDDSKEGDKRYKYREPITVPNEWTVVSHKPHFAHGGLSGVSPSRWISQAHLQHTSHPELSFVLLNTHYVAKAYNGKPDPHEAWRDDKWKAHFKKHKQVVAELVAAGHTVIWTGDANRAASMPLVHPNEKRFYTGYDKIGLVCPDGQKGAWTATAAAPVVLPVEAGHKAQVVKFKWKP